MISNVYKNVELNFLLPFHVLVQNIGKAKQVCLGALLYTMVSVDFKA